MTDPEAKQTQFEDVQGPDPQERAPPTQTNAPNLEQNPLPDLATRIREAKRMARERRIEAGLPADPDDGGYTPRKPKKHAPKRSKKHGQFLGTVCDSWEASRRRT